MGSFGVALAILRDENANLAVEFIYTQKEL